MASCVLQARSRTVLFLSTPALWPHWPFLPVVRCARGRDELGVVFDARAVGLTDRPIVYFTNLFLLPPDLPAFLALPRETFRTADELADAGWRVD